MTNNKTFIDSIKTHRLNKNDLYLFIALIKLFEDVFEMDPFTLPKDDHLNQLLVRDDFHVFVALLDDKVVGGLTAYVLPQYYSEKPHAYIADLAVATDLQRKGIGQQLIADTNAYFAAQGCDELFVQAEKEDDYAIDFYRKTIPDEELEAVHFSYQFNKGSKPT